jgi:hypothetical protein
LRAADSCHIATWARADHNHIVLHKYCCLLALLMRVSG